MKYLETYKFHRQDSLQAIFGSESNPNTSNKEIQENQIFFPQPGFTSKWHRVELKPVAAQVWEGKLWAGSLGSNAPKTTSCTAINLSFPHRV